MRTETEVGKPERNRRAGEILQKEVAWLDVEVDETFLMNIIQNAECLQEERPNLRNACFQRIRSPDPGKRVLSIDVFHHEEAISQKVA
jgi:hypothetical protein